MYDEDVGAVNCMKRIGELLLREFRHATFGAFCPYFILTGKDSIKKSHVAVGT